MSTANFYLSKEERDKLPLKVFGHPSKRLFPILSAEDVAAAARLLGRAKLSEAERKTVKKRIMNIALREGYKVPDAWTEEEVKASQFSANSKVTWFNQNGDLSFGILKSVDGKIATVELCNVVDGELISTNLTFNCNLDLLNLDN